MGNKVINPINNVYESILVDSVPSLILIKKYYDEFGINVEEYFNGIEQVDIYECVKTKYRFYYPFCLIGNSVFYTNLSRNKSNYYYFRWEHKLALKFAKKKSRWLEIGSGNSFFLKKLVENGVNAKGLELNKDEVETALKNELIVLNQDFFSYDHSSEKFDVIALFQVLEHISTISEFFKKAKMMLNVGGKIIFSVPNSNPYLYYFDKFHTLNLPPHHMGLWNKKAVKLVAHEFGFKLKVIKIEKLSKDELNSILKNGVLQRDYFKRNFFKLLQFVIKILPNFLSLRFINKLRLWVFEGRNVFVVFEK